MYPTVSPHSYLHDAGTATPEECHCRNRNREWMEREPPHTRGCRMMWFMPPLADSLMPPDIPPLLGTQPHKDHLFGLKCSPLGGELSQWWDMTPRMVHAQRERIAFREHGPYAAGARHRFLRASGACTKVQEAASGLNGRASNSAIGAVT